MAQERRVQGNWVDTRRDSQERRRIGHAKDSAGHVAKSDTCHRNADGGSHAPTRKKIRTVAVRATEKVDNKLQRKKMEKSEECGLLEM